MREVDLYSGSADCSPRRFGLPYPVVLYASLHIKPQKIGVDRLIFARQMKHRLVSVRVAASVAQITNASGPIEHGMISSQQRFISSCVFI